MMRLVFSKHAAKRLFERGISMRDITLTIEKPDYRVVRGNEIEAYKKFSGETLKVVHVKIESFIKVITVVII